MPASVNAGSALQDCHKLPNIFEWLLHNSIKLYIGITMSVSLVLSISVLFILLMQSVNRAQFLNTMFVFSLFGLSLYCATIDIASLTSIYASL